MASGEPMGDAEIVALAMVWAAEKRASQEKHKRIERAKAEAIVAGRSPHTDPAVLEAERAPAGARWWNAEQALEAACLARVDAVLGATPAVAANDGGR
jgi:hypothetical protein